MFGTCAGVQTSISYPARMLPAAIVNYTRTVTYSNTNISFN